MSKSALVVAGSLVILVAVAWALMGETGERGGAPAPSPVVADPLPEEAPAETLRPAEDASTAGESAPATPERVEAEPAAPGPNPVAAAGPFRLRFLQGEGGAPCPGAAVWWLPESEVSWSWTLPQSIELFRRNARPATADAAGLLVLDLPADTPGGGDVQLLAEWEGLSAFLSVEIPRDEPEDVELVATFDIEVLVQSEAGTPVQGIDVRFGPRDRYQGRNTEVPSDGEGRVVFRRASVALDEDAELPFVVAASGVFLDPPVVPLDRAALPGPPIVLVVPLTGSIAVEVRDPEGELLDGTASVELQLIPPGKPRDLSPFRNDPYPNSTTSLVLGAATFPHVPVGHEFGLKVTRPGQSGPAEKFVQGPLAAGQEVQVNLIHGVGQPILVFPLQDSGGAPLAERSVEVTTHVHTSFMVNRNEVTQSTDEEGRLEYHLPSVVEGADRRVILFELELDGVDHRARYVVTEAWPVGRHVMEPLVFGDPSLLVAGTVVDGAGAPVGEARIIVESGVDGFRWDTEVSDVRSAADGSFRIEHVAAGEKLRVRAETQEAQSPATEATAGDSGLVLTVQGVGGLSGTVLMDDPDHADQLKVLALPEGVSKHDDTMRSDVPEDLRFELGDLFPGRYDIRFELDNEAVLTIEGLSVSPGDPRADPRLRRVDLRGRIHAHRLTFRKGGELVDVQGTLTHRPAGQEEPRRWKWFRQNPFTLLTVEPAVDVTANVNGYRVQKLENLRGEREVELLDAIPVRLVLRSDVDLPEPPLYLKATLAPVSDPGMTDWGASTFDENNESTCRALATGPMQVRWVLERRADQGAIAQGVDIEGEQVEVLDSAAEQVFEITLKQEDVDRILAENKL